MNKNLKQKHYPGIEVDQREIDIVVIWQNEKKDSQVIHIERKNIPRFIKMITEVQPLKEK